MLKEIIQRYSQNINALRDFINSIQALLDEHSFNTFQHAFPDFSERYAKVRHKINELPAGVRDDLLKGSPKASKLKEELVKEMGIRFEVEAATHRATKTQGVSINFFLVGEEASQVFLTAAQRKDLLYRSSLITLISTVELCLSELLHFYFNQFPDAVGSREKVFSLDDLKKFGSIDDAKQHLVEEKVENLLRGSLDDWLKFLREQVKLSMGYLDQLHQQLTEIIQRRNLLVHNGGRVNSIYISKVDASLRGKLKPGDLLKIKPDYLNAALDTFEMVFILIGAELWKKLTPADNKRSDTLIGIAWEHLLNERWRISEGISFFVMNDKLAPEKERTLGQLNYWQSLKWQDRYGEIQREIDKADFSAKDELYQLALFALKDEKEEFFKLLPTVLDGKKLDLDSLATWPIFRTMRALSEYDEFIDAYKETATDSVN